MIQKKAIALSVSFSRFGNTRKVDTGSVQVNADKNLLSVSKKLFVSAEYTAIKRRDDETRGWLYARTLPSMFRAGIFLIPTPLVEEVYKKLKAIASDREKLVNKFLESYDRIMMQSALQLRALFNANDYPHKSEVARQFAMSWRIITLGPEALATVSEALFEEEKKKAEQEWSEATREIRNLLRTEMQGFVSDMVTKLAPSENGRAKVFKPACLDGIKEFLSLIDVRNIADDKELAKLTSAARMLLRGVNAESLSGNLPLQSSVQAGFKEISVAMDGMVIEKPTRAITFEDE